MPEPTLRVRYEAAIRATWDGTPMHMDEAIRTETDAVMAVRDEEMATFRDAIGAVTGQCRALEAELVAARSTIDRVQELADSLAARSGLGVDLEADGIRRGIADQLHAALGEPVTSEA